jgi:hypothetical protein
MTAQFSSGPATAALSLGTVEKLLLNVRCPEDLFGDDVQAARALHHRMTLAVHPDQYAASADRHRAEEAQRRINALWAEAGRRMDRSIYGNRDRIEPTSVRTKTRVYTLTERAASGDIADVYACTIEEDGGSAGEGFFKIARHPRDSDLMETEALALRHLARDGATKGLPAGPFLPELVESATVRVGTLSRRANIFRKRHDLVSLEQVKAVYPDGVDPRDMVWMFRRLLYALGMVHEMGIIHGAVTPAHILLEPAQHGLVLVDWCYCASPESLNTGVWIGSDHVRAVAPPYIDLYPPEVKDKTPVTPSHDLYMAAMAMLWITQEGRLPGRLGTFLRGCTLNIPRYRCQSAHALLEELDTLLGPRKFRPFMWPASATKGVS